MAERPSTPRPARRPTRGRRRPAGVWTVWRRAARRVIARSIQAPRPRPWRPRRRPPNGDGTRLLAPARRGPADQRREERAGEVRAPAAPADLRPDEADRHADQRGQRQEVGQHAWFPGPTSRRRSTTARSATWRDEERAASQPSPGGRRRRSSRGPSRQGGHATRSATRVGRRTVSARSYSAQGVPEGAARSARGVLGSADGRSSPGAPGLAHGRGIRGRVEQNDDASPMPGRGASPAAGPSARPATR